MTDFNQARLHMVDSQIHTNGVISPDILQAFHTVPREEFVPKAVRGMSYADEDISLGGGRFLLDPGMHAKMLQMADLQPSDIVLDIGCATGYSSAILSPLVTTVLALEENQDLLDRATSLWSKIGANNVVALKGALSAGSKEHAPYSLIIINGAVAEIPAQIVAQLSPEGRLLTVVRKAGQALGEVTVVRNLGAGRFSSYNLFSAGTPYLSGFEPKPAFVF